MVKVRRDFVTNAPKRLLFIDIFGSSSMEPNFSYQIVINPIITCISNKFVNKCALNDVWGAEI